MPGPLFGRQERRALYDGIAAYMPGRAATARQLAHHFNVALGHIHSVLVSLRAEGVVEVIGLYHDESTNGSPYAELLWGVTYHGQFHGVGEEVPPGRRCKHCRRAFSDW